MNDGTSSQKLMLLRRGKAMSGAPIMIGTNQLPKPPIIAGMTMKNTMIRPCAVMIAVQKMTPRRHQLDAHQHRHEPADDAGGNGEDEVERADVLVVRRTEP